MMPIKWAKPDDVSDSDAMLLFIVGTIVFSFLTISFTPPAVVNLCLRRLTDLGQELFNSSYVRTGLAVCLLAMVCGMCTSAAVRGYNGCTMLSTKLSVPDDSGAKQDLLNLLRPDQSFSELLDSCNDLDYAAQAVAIGGALPFVLTFNVAPKMMWKNVCIPATKWVTVTSLNAMIKFIDFLDRCLSHLNERLVVLWYLAERYSTYFINTIITPLVTMISNIISFLWNVISAIVTMIVTTIGNFCLTIINTTLNVLATGYEMTIFVITWIVSAPIELFSILVTQLGYAFRNTFPNLF